MKNQTYNITEVIACSFCQTGEDGHLLIGKPAKASQVPGITHCQSCRTQLHPGDIIAVGIDIPAHSVEEKINAA